MKNKRNIAMIGTFLIAVLAFGCGTYYGKSSASKNVQTFGNRSGMMGGNGTGRGGAGRMSNGFVGGEVISKDANGVVVKMRDGSSRIVFVSDKTVVSKSVLGALSDVVVGSDVTVTGTGNTDGSVTAQMIQIRPATTTSAR